MNFLFHVHGFPPTHNAGAEHYLYAIGKRLVAGGDAVRVLTGRGMLGEFDGEMDGVRIEMDSPAKRAEAYVQADVVVTHLDWTRQVIDECRRHAKPLAYVVHNPWALAYFKVKPSDVAVLIVNAEWLAEDDATIASWPGVVEVVRPPVWPDDYRIDTPAGERDCVVLCNLNGNKGAAVFFRLATTFPQYKFLGVRGYGKQEIPHPTPPNVEIVENVRDVRDILRRTRVLLMPSKFESFGRLALEAAASGIPTIAAPTPGLMESMGHHGATFVPLSEPGKWAARLAVLMDGPWEYAHAGFRALERSDEWDPDAEVDKFRIACELAARGRKWEMKWEGEGMGGITGEITGGSITNDMAAWTEIFPGRAAAIGGADYTLVCPFSRRWALGPWIDAMVRQWLPYGTEIVALADTQDPTFAVEVAAALKRLASNVTHGARMYVTGRRALPEDGALMSRRARVVDNWKRIMENVRGDVILGIEDDAIPQCDEAFRTLMVAADERGAWFAQGTIVGRWAMRMIPHWVSSTWRAASGVAHGEDVLRFTSSAGRGDFDEAGLGRIDGGGWFLFVAMARAFREVPMRLDGGAVGPDVLHVYDGCKALGMPAVGVWGVQAAHMTQRGPLYVPQGEVERVSWNVSPKGGGDVVNRTNRNRRIGSLDDATAAAKIPREGKVECLRTWSGDEGFVTKGSVRWISSARAKKLIEHGYAREIERSAPADRAEESADVVMDLDLGIPAEDAAFLKPGDVVAAVGDVAAVDAPAAASESGETRGARAVMLPGTGPVESEPADVTESPAAAGHVADATTGKPPEVDTEKVGRAATDGRLNCKKCARSFTKRTSFESHMRLIHGAKK